MEYGFNASRGGGRGGGHDGRCRVSGLQGRSAIPKWEICLSELRLAFFLNAPPVEGKTSKEYRTVAVRIIGSERHST